MESNLASRAAPRAKKKTTFEKLRRPLSTLAVLGLLVALWLTDASTQPDYRRVEVAFSFLLVQIAVLGRLWCILYIAGRKDDRLCVEGPYALCRNPLYLFSSLGLFGVLLATHHLPVALVGFGVFWVFYHFVIRNEEARLDHLFGSDFATYRQTVPRIIPRFVFGPLPVTLTVVVRPIQRAFREVIWFPIAWIGAVVVFGF